MSIIVENISFESEGHELIGRIYRPNEAGRFPAVAICHGFPGDNKNMDLAEELALNGVATLIFYYRGAWGSKGTYSFKGLEPSTKSAHDYLVSRPFVDPDSIGIIGYSMGAIPVAARLSSDRRLKTGVFISPAADFGLLAPSGSLEAVISIFMNMARGKLKMLEAEEIKADLSWVLENQNPVNMIGSVRVPIMVVVGSNDQMTPPDVCKLLYEEANEPKEWLLIEEANHEYSEHRVPLIDAVLGWLKGRL
jgi:dienelactone hydrolase